VCARLALLVDEPTSRLLEVVVLLSVAVWSESFDPGVRPNTDGLPGLHQLLSLVGATLTFGLVACVAAVAVSAATWALGSNSGNPHLAGRGKTGVVVSAGAALLIGAANALVTFFAQVGARV
jgi:hypothetical protein